MVRGHHIYKTSWTLVIGEVPIEREEDNQHDEHAVAVMKNGTIIGQVLRSISRLSWFFLQRGGDITCCITGKRKLGVGLEVACVYFIHCTCSETSKLHRLLAEETPSLHLSY